MKNSSSQSRTVALLTAILLAATCAQSQTIWNATNGVSANTNWSTGANWSTGLPPGAGENVQFADTTTTVAPGTINSVVDYTTNVNSLWFANTNGFHTIFIAPGQVLTNQGGVPGLQNTPLLNSGMDAYTISNQSVYATITGSEGTLVLANPAGSLQVRMGTRTNPATTKATLDLSGLGTFIADLLAIRAGVESADPRGVSGYIYLARTNQLTLRGTGFDANFSSGNPALVMGHNTANGLNNTNGSAIYLGLTNAIFVDYVVVARGNQTNCFFGFNPAFFASNPVAYFRGINQTNRVGAWKVGDNSAGSQTDRDLGVNDFTGGTVDALVNNMFLGFTRSSGANSNQGNGTLTFNLGTIDVNRLSLGYNTNELCTANGTMNVNGGMLIVNSFIQLGQVPAAATGATAANTSGTLNIRGGAQVFANTITNSGGIARLTITNGSLTVTNFIGGNGSTPVNFFAISNATLTIPAYPAAPVALVTNLAVGGTTNRINIVSAPAIGSYPYQVTLIKYSGALVGTFNVGLGTLPASPGTPYSGFISNNTANSSIDLVLANGPVSRSITWTGTAGNGDWDVGTTLNWQTNAVATVFNQTDFARLDDSAPGVTDVNLTTQLIPGSLTVSNTSLTYTLTGPGYVSGSGPLLKQGSGKLILANSGVNDYFGGVSISNGTVQIGNYDPSGNLAGAGNVLNNGNIVFTRSDDQTLANAISGSGSITKSNTSSRLTLSGANTFTGAVNIVEGTLIAGSSSALGITNGVATVSAGATLDVSGGALAANALNLGPKRVVVSGDGIGFGGAIVNSGSAGQQNALQNVTLAGNTTIGGVARWDIRAPSGTNATLLTGGNSYNLTKVGGNFIGLVSPVVDPGLGDIDVQSGVLDLEGNITGLGDPAKTLTVEPGASLFLFNTTNLLNKQIVLNGDGITGTLTNGSGANTIIGPMTINSGDCLFAVRGTSLTLSNTISGPGRLFKASYGTNTLIIAGTASHGGGTLLSDNTGITAVNGTVTLNVDANGGTILTGTGTIGGTATVSGTLNPGTVNGAGTLTAGSLVMPGGNLTVDLASVNTIGSGVNDLVTVTGDLDAQGATVTVNVLQTTLSGTYRLLNYGGNLVSAFGSVSPSSPTRYVLGLDTLTANQVNLLVSGSPNYVKWFSGSSSLWDTFVTPNWSNAVTAVSPDYFYAADSVLLDDTAGVTNTLTIISNTAVLPLVVTNNSSVNSFTVSGGGKISGAASIVKLGSSTLTLATANDFTGPVLVLAGTLRAANNAALGATNGSTTIASGASLDLGGTNLAANALNLGTEPLFVSGTGVGGNGAIINTGSNNQQNAIQVMTLTGDTTWGGPSRWDIRAVTSTNAVLSTGGNPYNLTKISANQIQLASPVVDPALANINVLGGTLGVQGLITSLGNPANTLTVSNATLHFFQVSNVLNKVVVLQNGATLNNNSGSNIFGGPITLVGSNRFDTAGNWMLLTNVISGTGILSKLTGGSPLLLSASNTFAGRTLVSNGILALTNNGSIRVCSNITVTATIDVNGRTDKTLTLSSGQTLNGTGTIVGNLVSGSGATTGPGLSIGTLTVTNGNVTLQAGSATLMEVNRTNSTNADLLRGHTNITYGGTLVISNIGPALVGGDSFKLFTATNYLGSFASIVPTQPGLGLKWDTSQLNLSGITAGGMLRVAALPRPALTNVSLSGGNLIIGGTNGTSGFTYRVLASTNVALPVGTWNILGTNSFDGSGNFQFSAGTTNQQLYFIIQAL